MPTSISEVPVVRAVLVAVFELVLWSFLLRFCFDVPAFDLELPTGLSRSMDSHEESHIRQRQLGPGICPFATRRPRCLRAELVGL